MSHIHEQPGQHDLTVSAYIVRTDGPEPAIMLHEHRKLGKLLQFGGHVELDENPWQGLLRELREESGYGAEQLSVYQPPHRFNERFEMAPLHPLPFEFNTHRFKPAEAHFHSDLVYAAVASGPPRHEIGAGESANIRLFTAAELNALPAEAIFNLTRASANYILATLIHEWQPVPASDWPVPA